MLIFIICSVLHSFLWIWVNILCHFLSAWTTSLNIYCRTYLLAMNSLHVSLFGNIYFTLIYYGLMGIKFRVDSFFSFIPLNVYIFSLGSYVKLPVNFIVVLLFTINVYFLAISKYPRFCFFSFSSLSMICLGVYLCVYFT